MLKKLVLLSIPALLLVIVFVPIYNNLIYYSLYVLLFLLALSYYYLDSVISIKMLNEYLKTSEFFSIKAGFIKLYGSKSELIYGRLVVVDGKILFLKKVGGKKLLEPLFSHDISKLKTYTLKKVDTYHDGIELSFEKVGDISITSKEIYNKEGEFLRSLGWIK